MSNHFVVSKDPRVDIKSDNDLTTVIDQGGQRVSYSRNASTNYGQDPTRLSYTTWTINPPSNQTIISRELNITHYIEVTADVPFLLGTYDCLRQFPVASLVDSINLKVNGSAQATKRCADLVHAEMNFYNEPECRRRAFMAPAYPDQFGLLEQGDGFNRNPAVFQGENVEEPSRGALIPVEVLNGGRTLRYKVVEPVFISPLLDGCGRAEQGMVNVNEIYLQLYFKSIQDRVMTCMPRPVAAQPDVANITVGYYSAPELTLLYITPDMMSMIPAVQTLGYIEPDFHRKTGLQPFAIDTSRTVQSDTFRIGQIPKMVMAWLPRSEGANGFNKPDSYLSIEGVKVQWNNENSLLTMASAHDLYQISRRNGLNCSYHTWLQRGAPLMLEMGKDVGLPDGLAPGVVGSFTLRVEVIVRNNNNLENNAPCDLCVALYNQGTFVIAQNTGRISLGVSSPSMVLAAERADSLEHGEHPQDMPHAGSLLNKLHAVIPKKHRHKAMSAMTPAPAPKSEPRRIGGSGMRR